MNTPFKNQSKIKWLIFLSLALTLFLNQFYRHPLYALGVEVIIKVQAWENTFLDWFFMVVTMLIDPLFVFVGVIAMVVLSHRKQKGLIMLCFILFNTFLAALIKAYHCDPRPFWTSFKVKNIGIYCPVEYGNPSGHSWFSVMLGFGVLCEYRGSGRNYINIVISMLLVILVPMSRMYLGAHSLNQVLEGLVFGSCIVLLFKLGFNKIINKFLTEFNHNKIWKFVIICMHILSIIPFIWHMDEQLPDKWLLNINKRCIKNMNEARLNQLMFIVNAMMINLLTGVALGYEQLVKSAIGAMYLTGKWRINENKYGRIYTRIFYIGTEVAFMTCGFAVAGIFYWIHPNFVSGYIGVSVGGIFSGYMYTTRVAQHLSRNQIIKKHLDPKQDLQKVQKQQSQKETQIKDEAKKE